MGLLNIGCRNSFQSIPFYPLNRSNGTRLFSISHRWFVDRLAAMVLPVILNHVKKNSHD